MRKVFLLLTLLWAWPAWATPTLLDDFNRSADPIDGSWNSPAGADTLALRSNHAEKAAVPGTGEAIWTGNTYAGDQAATITITLTTDSFFARSGVLLKATENQRDHYLCGAALSGGVYTATVVKYVAGAFNSMASANVSWVNGDKLSCTVTGTTTLTITVYQNGTSVLTATDDGSGTCTGCAGVGVETGQRIGMGIYAGDLTGNATADDFSSGKVDIPITTPVVSVIMVE